MTKTLPPVGTVFCSKGVPYVIFAYDGKAPVIEKYSIAGKAGYGGKLCLRTVGMTEDTVLSLAQENYAQRGPRALVSKHSGVTDVAQKVAKKIRAENEANAVEAA